MLVIENVIDQKSNLAGPRIVDGSNDHFLSEF